MSLKDVNLMPLYLPLVVLNSVLLSVVILYFLRSVLIFSILVPFFAVFSLFLYLKLDGEFRNRIELGGDNCEVYKTMKNTSILINILSYNKKQFSFLVLYFFVIIYVSVFIPTYAFFKLGPSIGLSILSYHLYLPILVLSIAVSTLVSAFLFVESTNIYFEDDGYIHVKPFTSELSIDCDDIQDCEVHDKYLVKSLYIKTSGEEYRFYTMEADSIQKKIVSNRI